MNSQKRKIKILFAIGDLGIGGAEKLVQQQIRFLNREVFDVYLATFLPKPKYLLGGQLDLSKDHLFSFQFKSFFDFGSWRKFIAFLKRERFDIVYSHLFFANLVARASAIFAKVPVIVSIEHNIYRDKKWWYILTDKILAHFTAKIIAVSESVKNFTISQEKISPDKFEVIYNGVDIEPIQVNKVLEIQSLGIKPEDVIVTAVGRIIKQKGFIYLVKAAKKILSKSANVVFLIVGPPREKQIVEEIEKEIGSDFKDRIRLLGPRQDVNEILAISDIFVMPSLWEGFGIAAMEAMATSLPVIVSNIDGLKEFVIDGKNGILVDPENITALSSAILKLIECRDLRIELGANALKTSQKFSIGNNIKRLEEVFLSRFKPESLSNQ